MDAVHGRCHRPRTWKVALLLGGLPTESGDRMRGLIREPEQSADLHERGISRRMPVGCEPSVRAFGELEACVRTGPRLSNGGLRRGRDELRGLVEQSLGSARELVDDLGGGLDAVYGRG